MDSPYNENPSFFSVEFDGSNAIDAKTAAQTINCMADSLQYISDQIMPKTQFQLEVTSFSSGSFHIGFNTVVSLLELGIAAYPLIKSLVGTIKIKLHLKGEEPAKIEKVDDDNLRIINLYGENIIVNEGTVKCYFNNNTLDKNFSELFKHLSDSNEKRKNMRIVQNGQSLATIPDKEFPNMAIPIIGEKEGVEQTETSTIEAYLLIKKTVFVGNSQWGFMLDNHSINAHIIDLEWLNKVQSGQISLSAGMVLHVMLEITAKFDEKLNPISKTYAVLKVIGDVIPPEVEQITLF